MYILQITTRKRVQINQIITTYGLQIRGHMRDHTTTPCKSLLRKHVRIIQIL